MMIDALFEASIADVLDEFVTDQRLKDALFGQGVIGTFAGPRDPGTASVKLMHYQGDLLGEGPIWGYVKGGMGMVSFAIAEAAREAGAVLAAGVPVGEILPGEGVRLEDGTFIAAPVVVSNADPKRVLGLVAGDAMPDGVPRPARDVGHPQPGREVQRGAVAAAVLHGCTGRDVHGTRDRRRDRRPRRRAGGVRAMSSTGEPAVGFGEIYCQTAARPVARAAGQAPAERLRPVRAVRPQRRLGRATRRGRAGSSST